MTLKPVGRGLDGFGMVLNVNPDCDLLCGILCYGVVRQE